MTKQDRDRLDGTDSGSPLKELFLAPGRIALWIYYMFPGNSYRSVRMTARHARSPLMTFFYSLIFWGLLAIGIIGGLLELLALSLDLK